MITRLKSIPIDSASWPRLPPKTQPQKILYSEARGDGYEQSDALRTFGAPRPIASSPAKPAVKFCARNKYLFLKLGLAACAMLLAGLALADPHRCDVPSSATDQTKQEGPEMNEAKKSLTATLPGNTVAPVISSEQHGQGYLSTSPPAQATPPSVATNAIEPVENLKTSSYEIALAEQEMTGIYATAAAAVAILGTALAVSRRRRSVPIPDKTTQEIEHTPADPPALHEPEPVITSTPPLSGLAYVEPAALLGSMKRAFPKLRITEASETFALTSVTGHNAENQDYALAFDFSSPTLGPIQVAFLADGCGGHHGGRAASYTAVSSCVEHLLKSTERHLSDVARGCLEAASQHMSSVGTQMWDANDFRCTLIVLLANQTEYALAHIGDGGMDVRRADGSWERMLTPQREEKTGYLTGSLGPCPYGNAVINMLPRMPGDWLVAGTDGVYVDEMTNLEEFWAWPRKALNNGRPIDLGRVLNTYIAKCLHDLPNIFDDNVTALVLTTPTVPTTTPVIAKTLGIAATKNDAMANCYKSIAAMNR